MNHEISIKVRYGWQHSRGHAMIQVHTKYQYYGSIDGCLYVDLNSEAYRTMKYKSGSDMNDYIQEVMQWCKHVPSITIVALTII